MKPITYDLRFSTVILFLIFSIYSNLPFVFAQDNPKTTPDNKSGEPELAGSPDQAVEVPQGESRRINVLHKVIVSNYPSRPSPRDEFDNTSRQNQMWAEASRIAAEDTGVLEGKFVYADNSPTTSGSVKVVDKVDLSRSYPMVYIGSIADNVFYEKKDVSGISRDAQVWEKEIDHQGRFQFKNIPPGEYFLFWQIPDCFPQYFGRFREWTFQYDKGEPIKHIVKKGQTTVIPPIESIKQLTYEEPIPILEKSGMYELSWPEIYNKGYCKLAIKHKNYGEIIHPAYGSVKVKGFRYKTPDEYPLYPGEHEYQVEILTPTERTYAKGNWVKFVVPGDIYFLKVSADKTDPSGRIVNWFGSDIIHSVKITLDGGLFKRTSEQTVKFPPASSGRNWVFQPLDKDGKELILGWKVTHWQPETKRKEEAK